MITALIVDDEIHSRNVLKKLLGQYCQEIQIVAEAKNVDEAYELILKKNPQLVFLDVKMPEKTGFDLLQLFESINFEVIFISAFNEYAVTAFEFNALGYVLKPIDFNKLILMVNKAMAKIGANAKNTELTQFMNTLEPDTHHVKKIALHHNEKVVFVDISEIVSIQSQSGICEIKLMDRKHYYSTRDLKLFEDLLKKNGNFLRISKNCVLNLDFIKAYQKGEVCILEMSDGSEFEVSRRKKTEIISRLKVD